MQYLNEANILSIMPSEEIPRGFVPRRILVIQLRQVGDALMCTPSLRALRSEFPQSRIDFLAEPGAAKAVRGNPNIDRVVLIDPREGWAATPRVIFQLRSARYDLAVDYLINPTSTMISKFSGARYTLSFGDKSRSRFYTHAVMPKGKYSAENKLSLLRALGIENGELRPEFYVSSGAAGRMDNWIASAGPGANRFAVVDPTHRRITRKYTRYAEVARLVKDRLGISCVFVWGPGEEDEVRKIAADAGEGHFVAPRTDLDELGALIRRAAFLTGNDSAPRHIAAALGVPTVVPTGSTRPENWTLPESIHKTVNLDVDCRPCSSNKCKKREVECMTRLDPEKVFGAIEEIIG